MSVFTPELDESTGVRTIDLGNDSIAKIVPGCMVPECGSEFSSSVAVFADADTIREFHIVCNDCANSAEPGTED